MITIETLIQSEYFRFLAIFISSIILARVFYLVFNTYLKNYARRTKTQKDDMILAIISKPIYILIIITGLFLGLKCVAMLEYYFPLLDGIFFAAYVLIISFMASRILSILVGRWLKVQKRFEKTPQLVNKIIAITIYIIAILIILSHFRIEITPMIAALGLGGLAVGLALQNTLSNFFAGLHIISDRPINVGNFIELGGDISGYVEDIGWRSTRIRTITNNIVIVPNSKLAESVITNDSLPQQEITLMFQCGVSYGSDLKKVERITEDVARKIQKAVPGAVKTFEPFMRFVNFGDSNINFIVFLRIEKYIDRYLVIHEFIKALKERYDRERIAISYPVRQIVSKGRM